MERGHVKLWRKSIDSGLIQSPNLWAFWSWCLLKATWKNRSVVMNMQTINLLPGQLVFGRKAASKELNMSEQTIRTCLEKLKKLKNITIQSTSHYSIISVVNWDNYQGCQPTDNHLINQPPTSRQPAANHKQEVKEIKEGKEKDLLSDSSESGQTKKQFKKPSIEEITIYCQERKNRVDPDKFFNFYESKGWMIGKNKMKNWRSAIITWEKGEDEKPGYRKNESNSLFNNNNGPEYAEL